METIHFSIQINAPKEKVWDTMLSQETYKQWASAFHEGSRFDGSWEQGEKIRFIGPMEDGKGEGGMVSRIKENRKYEYISIEHLGIIANGLEDTSSDEARKWTPAFENYTFTEMDGGTELQVDLDVVPEYKDMFQQMWPKALDSLKALAEK